MQKNKNNNLQWYFCSIYLLDCAVFFVGIPENVVERAAKMRQQNMS
jgi:hypothetical protein